MKTLLMILAICLSACQNAPTVRDTEQCFVYFNIDENEQVNIDGSYCGCRMYRFSREYVGMVPNTHPYKMPLNYCQKIIGWTPDEYLEVSTFWENVRKFFNNNQQN